MNRKNDLSELQAHIERLERELALARGTRDELRIEGELSDLMIQQHIEKPLAEVEEEYRTMAQEFKDGKLIDFGVALSELSDTAVPE